MAPPPFPRFDDPPTIEVGGYVAAGPSPSTAQANHARDALDEAMVGGLVAQSRTGRGRTVSRLDMTSPQRFVTHPAIANQLDAASIGVESAPHLPGRVPPPAWDGEPGWGAPEV